jgi:PPK2 family polyphosphate:nucleotide phosphotransferase
MGRPIDGDWPRSRKSSHPAGELAAIMDVAGPATPSIFSDTQEPTAVPSADERLHALIHKCCVPKGRRVRLKQYDTSWGGKALRQQFSRKQLESLLAEDVAKLAKAQDLLYAADSWSVLLILQAMDAAGKDSTIKHVMSGLNPQGCQVHAFKPPSPEELEHDFLWRCAKALPERGRIGIFNRSYYEEVLVVKVHRGLLAAEHLPHPKSLRQLWQDRFEDINHFERHLFRNGTLILKFFLHISKEEQRTRFLDRINMREKHWKFSPADVLERKCWNKYIEAYEDCLSQTNTEWAPWYIIPADQKWVTRTLVASIVTHAICNLHLEYPRVTEEQRKEIKKAKRQLAREGK